MNSSNHVDLKSTMGLTMYFRYKILTVQVIAMQKMGKKKQRDIEVHFSANQQKYPGGYFHKYLNLPESSIQS